jgi:predicted O-linked N-acetylglucosamine transferase (SPINDLY family)
LCVRPLLETGQGDAAAALCEELLAEQPDNIPLRLSQIEATIATGDMEGGIRHAEELLKIEPDNVDAMSALGFHYQYLADMSVGQRRAHAERYAALLRRTTVPYRDWPNLRDVTRKLRIGLVSGDMRHHPVAFFMRALLGALQGRSLEFYVYDTLGKHDELTGQIRPLIHRWHEVKSLKDKELAELIRADCIDILLDLHGYTTGNRLPMMALKPAPVQLSWLGFLGTTGTPGIDYVLADARGAPEGIGAEDEFTEAVWRLPECAQCFTPPDVDVPETPPPVLVNGFITFGCLNKPHKINDRVLALWSKVLARLPTSRLLLRGNGFGSPPYRERFIARMKALGIDPTRVMLEGPAPRAQFLNAYSRIDISLDPFPYSGGTTTAEALWVGVPVLALRGDRMVWRMSYSFMAAAGLGDWAADDEASFVELAVAKASDIEGLAALRKVQRQQVLKSPLCDATRFAANVEQAFRDIWRGYASVNQSGT